MIKDFFIDDFVSELQVYDKTQLIDLPFTLSVPIEGLETPPVRISQYSKPGEDGLVISNTFYDGRVITIPGTIYSGSPTDYLQARKDITYVCRLLKDDNGFPISQKFRFALVDDEEYFFYGRPKVSFGIRQGKFTPFLLTIICPDSFIYSGDLQSSGSISVPIPGGAIYPVIYPVIYDPSSGGFAAVNNTGNAPSFPTLFLRGILTDPYILNSTTGEFMQLDVTTTNGDDVIEIDMLNKTITLNGTSILGSKIGDSTWWALQPGVNNIYFSTGVTSDTGTLTIEWYNALLGI